jgi:hypothetical protein
MTTVLYVLAFLALAYIAGLTVGVMSVFLTMTAHEHGRRSYYENKINKP